MMIRSLNETEKETLRKALAGMATRKGLGKWSAELMLTMVDDLLWVQQPDRTPAPESASCGGECQS